MLCWRGVSAHCWHTMCDHKPGMCFRSRHDTLSCHLQLSFRMIPTLRSVYNVLLIIRNNNNQSDQKIRWFSICFQKEQKQFTAEADTIHRTDRTETQKVQNIKEGTETKHRRDRNKQETETQHTRGRNELKMGQKRNTEGAETKHRRDRNEIQKRQKRYAKGQNKQHWKDRNKKQEWRHEVQTRNGTQNGQKRFIEETQTNTEGRKWNSEWTETVHSRSRNGK